MATAETVQLGPPHEPKEESVRAFLSIETELKTTLQNLRHQSDKHEPEYFAAVRDLSDHQVTTFNSESDLVLVRTAKSAYGLHLFGKIKLPESNWGYIHVRVFVAKDVNKLHSIHTEEKEQSDGSKTYKAIFSFDDPLEWFDT